MADTLGQALTDEKATVDQAFDNGQRHGSR
jgi:hypothetical protein